MASSTLKDALVRSTASFSAASLLLPLVLASSVFSSSVFASSLLSFAFSFVSESFAALLSVLLSSLVPQAAKVMERSSVAKK